MAFKQETGTSLQELRQALREKKTANFYIFHGEETFLLHYYLSKLKKQLVNELTESFNYHKLTKENFDLYTLADAVESLPMMAESTFVWVDDIDIFKFPEADRSKLQEIFSDVPEYCTLIMTFETVPWNPDKKMKKLWDAIQNNAKIVEFPKQSQKDLIAWIDRHFAAEGKRISPALCSYLIDITGGTMTALAGEISKIAAFSGADTIVKSDIDAVTEPVLDAVVFQMTDLLADGKYGPALEKLQTLLKMQEKPLSILGAIGTHIRRLGTARTLLDNGKGVSDFMRICNVREYPAEKSMRSAKRFSARFCAVAAELVLETDMKLKTSYDAPERLLELLVLQLAQEAHNG